MNNNNSVQNNLDSASEYSINSEDIVQYLKNHPDFFEQHPSLLTDLEIPHTSKGATSLVERQVSLLREHNIELRKRMGNLLEAAKENDQLFQKTQSLTLSLIPSQSLDEIAEKLEHSLKEEYNTDSFSVLLFDTDLVTEKSAILRAVKSKEAIEFIPGFIKLEKAVCGHLRDSEKTYLFPECAEQIGSAALVPISKGNLEGLLVIGSFDDKHFHHRMGTLFITYIGNLVANIMNNLMR